MRPTTESLAEIEFHVLSTPEGQALLDEVNEVVTPGPRDLQRWRKWASAETVHAAISLSETRRRGLAKFSRAASMWFDRLGLEQSTTELVARHKAVRFAGADVVDLCCGIGGDTLAMAERARGVIAVDRDLGMLRRTLWNARAYGVDSQVLAVRSEAETFPIAENSLVHIDPDRRATSSKRSLAIASYRPGMGFLQALPDRCRGGAIKLSPASDFDELFADRSHEVEIISLGGECKEATVWFGDRITCSRRATTLPSGETWTDRHAIGVCGIDALSSWVYDPDPALIRSGLLEGFAHSRDLRRFESGINLFTSADRQETPWLASFEVVELLPLDVKHLRAAVRAHDFGTLEIKPRGVNISPESLRKEINAQGSRPGTIFPIRGRSGSMAILARRACDEESRS